jgi:diguanylate cyclase (GGDEF)-like protein
VLRCLTRAQARPPAWAPSTQLWLDLDSGIALGTNVRGTLICFYTTPAEIPAALSASLLVRKPCSPSTVVALWNAVLPCAAVRATADEIDNQGEAPALPGWLLELHELDLRHFCRNCIETVPEQLGYSEAALYLHDTERRLLTLAEANSQRPIDLSVSLTADDNHALAMVARSGKPLISDDLATSYRRNRMRAPAGLTSGAGVIAPLLAQRKLRGLLLLSGDRAPDATRVSPPLEGIFAFLARCLHHAQRHRRARIEARVDRLTGLFNYRWMMEALGKEIHRSKRHGSPLSLIMLDLDGLKSVNDRFGHLGGDALLRHTAGKISAALRQIDSAARIGGDEFVVLLPATNLSGARHVAQRILSAIRTDAPLIDRRMVPAAASLGVAQWEDTWDARQLIAAADQAMYTAKRQGHNHLVCHRRRRSAKSTRRAPIEHAR